MNTETITWHPVANGLPDADLTVNVATEGCEEPTWLGFHDGDCWRDVDGLEIRVTHWAPMLAGPATRPRLTTVQAFTDLSTVRDGEKQEAAA